MSDINNTPPVMPAQPPEPPPVQPMEQPAMQPPVEQPPVQPAMQPPVPPVQPPPLQAPMQPPTLQPAPKAKPVAAIIFAIIAVLSIAANVFLFLKWNESKTDYNDLQLDTTALQKQVEALEGKLESSDKSLKEQQTANKDLQATIADLNAKIKELEAQANKGGSGGGGPVQIGGNIIGSWNAVTVETMGIKINLKDMGMDGLLTLTVTESSAVFASNEDETLNASTSWSQSGDEYTFNIDGEVMTGRIENGVLILEFTTDGTEMSFHMERMS